MVAATATVPALTIGEVASRAGLRTSAIRYYEDAGLLPKAYRLGGKRRYDAETVDRLLFIRFCQRLGFALADIRRLLTDSPTGRPKRLWRQLVDSKLGELAALVRAAKGIERVLRESRDCDCVTLSACRFVQREAGSLQMAGQRRRRQGY